MAGVFPFGGTLSKQLLTESWDGAFAEAVSADGFIRNVKLLGKVSKNRRVYSEQAMRDAARLYDGVHVYFDHSESDSGRSVRDLAGRVRSPRFSGTEVRGDLQLIDFGESQTSPATFFRALAEQMPEAVGMSHTASGVLVDGPNEGDPQVVESLDAVASVDLVTNPATTAGIFESLNNPREGDMKYSDITLDELRRNRPDLLESVRKDITESDEQKAVRAERDQLRSDLDAARAAEKLRAHRDLVAEKLAAAKLPEQVVTGLFREQLNKADDAAAVDALIAERTELAKSVGARGPRSTEHDLDESLRTRDGEHTEVTEEVVAGVAPGGANSLFI